MKYLKYFENVNEKLWKRIESEEADIYIKKGALKSMDLLEVTESEFDKFIDIIGYNHNLTITIVDNNKIHIMTNTVFGYTIYLFSDEYFIIREDRYGSLSPHSLSKDHEYFLVDGWDGLEQIISTLTSSKKMS